MYERFFNLRETPFSIAPNPHYLYMSRQHHEALAHLIYGVGRDGGFVLLTGEVGTGKTTVCRCFLEQIPDDTDVAFVLNPKMNVEELLATICDELSIPYIGDSISIKDFVDCINNFLLRQHANGRHTVLIIDEAQNLSADVLEQLRLLTNLETHEKKLLQIVLLGQPELQDMFRQPELRQLSQRVTARFHLNAMQAEEVGPYVYHRLAVAGAIDPRGIFPAKVIERLHQISKGIPRVINLVCDRALLGAYSRDTRVVDLVILNNAANEVLGTRQWQIAPSKNTTNWISAAAVALACVAVGALGGWLWFTAPDSEPQTLASTTTAVDELPAPAATGSMAVPPPSIAEPVMAVPTIEQPPEPAPMVAALAEAKPALMSLAVAIDQSTIEDEGTAYIDLFKTWGVEYDPLVHGSACKFADNANLACLSKMGSLGSIKHFGVPVILRLFGDGGAEKFLVLRRLDGNTAQVVLNGEEKPIDISDLDLYWRGHFSLLWKKPPSYHGPLQPGTIAPLSKWLSYQLDVWEKKPNPEMGRSTYDEEMVERVKAFQRYVGETDDGVVGTGTLIQLSRRVDETIPTLLSERGGS